MRERTAVIGNEQVTLSWSESDGKLRARVGVREYELELRRVSSGLFWLGWNGGAADVIVTPDNGGYDVSIRGHRIHVEFLESSKRVHRQAAGTGSGIVEIKAPMPGKVVRLLRHESDEVQAQQGILVIEAMKMQNEIRSPKAGRILELRVREGETVGLGQLIARVGN
jgi:biotin carboxyl carrier protein